MVSCRKNDDGDTREVLEKNIGVSKENNLMGNKEFAEWKLKIKWHNLASYNLVGY
jgi:hypothetical protein